MKLKAERANQNLTQNDLKQKSGVGLNTIVKLEKGKIDGVRVGTLKKIAESLNSSIKALFFSDDEE